MNNNEIILKRKLAVITLIFGFFISSWVATQVFANYMNHHPVLYPYIVYQNSNYLIYNPLSIYFWIFKYYTFAKVQFVDSIRSGILSFSLFIAILLYLSYRPQPATAHGTAEWLSEKDDLVKAGLLPKNGEQGAGVFLGVNNDEEYLRHNGAEHIICMAPTRSGKGVSMILNTLLSWQHSAVVLDIKGENWGITAAYRKSIGQKVLCFNPADNTGMTCRFNPMEEIRIGTPDEVKDAQGLAQTLLDPDGKGASDHWVQSGMGFLTGVILWICYTKRLNNEIATLSDIISFLTRADKPFEEILTEDMKGEDKVIETDNGDEVISFAHINPEDTILKELYNCDGVIHPIVASAAAEMLNKADKERAGVLSTTIVRLNIYRDPILAKNTSKSDFKITDLMNYETPVTLYLVIQPADLTRLISLIRIIITLITTKLLPPMEFRNGEKVGGNKHRLLLLLDEFPALGRLDNLEAAFAFIAGYGIKAFIIVQSVNQLNKSYTDNNSIIDNCHIRIFFAPNDAKTPELISKLLGTKTEKIISESWKGFRWWSTRSYSTQLVQRPLLTPGEISLLDESKMIVFITGYKPLLVNKCKYFEDENFRKRYLGINTPEKSDTLLTIEKDFKKD